MLIYVTYGWLCIYIAISIPGIVDELVGSGLSECFIGASFHVCVMKFMGFDTGGELLQEGKLPQQVTAIILLPLPVTADGSYTLNANTKARARPTTELSAVMLIPVAEAAFLPEPPVVELALLPPVLPPVLPPLDVDPFTSWVTAKNETPASVAHSELFSGAAAARKKLPRLTLYSALPELPRVTTWMLAFVPSVTTKFVGSGSVGTQRVPLPVSFQKFCVRV